MKKLEPSKPIQKKKLVLDRELIRVLELTEIPGVVVGGRDTGVGCCSGRIMC